MGRQKNQKTTLFDQVCKLAMENITVKKFEDIINKWEPDKLMNLKAEAKAVDMTATFSVLISILAAVISAGTLAISIVGNLDDFGCLTLILEIVICIAIIVYAGYIENEAKKNKNKNLYRECILLAIENIEKKDKKDKK